MYKQSISEIVIYIPLFSSLFLVFGVSLEMLMSSKGEEGKDVPSFVEKSIQALTQRGLKEEGLFRLSARARDMQVLREMIDKGKPVNFVVCFSTHLSIYLSIHPIMVAIVFFYQSLTHFMI